MSDLTFTAGIDDRGVRSGLRELHREVTSISGGISGLGKAAKFGGALLGAATVVMAIRKLWHAAGEAVHAYAHENMVAADELRGIAFSFHKAEVSAGRFLTMMMRVSGATEALTKLGKFTNTGIEDLTKSLAPESYAKLLREERETRRQQQIDFMRDTGGPIEEDILNLQGRHGEADRLHALRQADVLFDRLTQLRKDGVIDEQTAMKVQHMSNQRLQLQLGQAMIRDLHSFSGDVPRGLRSSVSGVTLSRVSGSGADGNRNSEQNRNRADANASKERNQGNQLLKKIETNTRSGSARYK